MIEKEEYLDKIKEKMKYELDMIEGNLNRMAVTDDKKELEVMAGIARARLETIEQYKLILLEE